MTKKIMRNITLSFILLAIVGEFLSCFLRGYPEFWLTILIVSMEIIGLAAVGWLTKFHFFSLMATALGLTGCILLIGFPSYIPFVALTFFSLSLVSEILTILIRNKK